MTTQTLDCPRCGAPLNFQPHPGDETVECPFCHETVIIPKDLRIPLPRVPLDRPVVNTQPRRTSWAAIIIVGVVFIAIITAIIVGANSSDQSSVDFPTDTVISSADSGTATIEAQATVDALQPILTLEQSWPVFTTDAFKDNTHEWPTGDVRDSYITGNRSISSGIYSWNITSVQGTSDFAFPTMADQTDFYASVDMKLVKMPQGDSDADAGLVFRYNDSAQTWYYFSVNDIGQYYFGWYNGTDWYTLIPETDSAAIHPGEINRLTVGVQGSQFIFIINGQMVDHFIDENLKSGSIGVGLNLPQADEKGTVEFSNFTVLASGSKP